MAGNDRNLKQRPSVAKKAQPSGGSKGGPQKFDGRDRIRPGTYDKPKAGWDGPGRVLKNEP